MLSYLVNLSNLPTVVELSIFCSEFSNSFEDSVAWILTGLNPWEKNRDYERRKICIFSCGGFHLGELKCCQSRLMVNTC